MTDKLRPPGLDDAARDGLALTRAYLAGDWDAAAIVAANLANPMITACMLADWLAGTLAAIGEGEAALRALAEKIGLDQG